ncbi:hypothetical protein HC891_06970 [Candidatus Gracilibacteria bacterium]|nr:hypothetical protein [Candidatus Gracilibacteria bacterium]
MALRDKELELLALIGRARKRIQQAIFEATDIEFAFFSQDIVGAAMR